MSTISIKELSHPAGQVIKIASGKTLDLKSQGTTTLPTGSVLQVVSTHTTSSITTSSTSMVATGLIATLTPSSTSSKILVTLSGGRTDSGGGHSAQVSLNSSIGGASYAEILPLIENRNYDAYAYLGMAHSFSYLYSPSTVSSVAIQPYFKTTALTNYFNSGSVSITLTLQEIQG